MMTRYKRICWSNMLCYTRPKWGALVIIMTTIVIIIITAISSRVVVNQELREHYCHGERRSARAYMYNGGPAFETRIRSHSRSSELTRIDPPPMTSY